MDRAKNELTERIIQYIKQNRVSTTEVADCMGKSGALPDVYPINEGFHRVGKSRYVYGFLESNWCIHEQIRDTQPGEIIIIDGIEVNDRALIGELVTKYLLLYRQAEAIVVLGRIRDANDLLRMNYAVWCKGRTPIGCFNSRHDESETIKEIVLKQKNLFEDSVTVCDDTGVVVIPRDILTERFYKQLEHIEEQEDQWFYCIDRLKWDTFDTVCRKKYLEREKVLLIGGAEAQCHVIRILQEMGFICIVADYDSECLGREMADLFLEISTRDVDALCDAATRNKVTAVISVQSDSGAMSAAEVSQRLGLKGLPEPIIRLFTDKGMMRHFLKKNGFRCPEFRLCGSKDDFRKFADKTGYPIVIKPINSQGSRGVHIVENEKDIPDYWDIDQCNFKERGIIAETFLGTQEYTVEGICIAGKHFTLGVSEKKHFRELPFVSRELRYIWRDEYQELALEHDRLIEKTKLPFGITHSEYIRNGEDFTLVEFAARGGGSMIASHIVPAISGWDVEKIYVQEILEQEINLPPLQRKCAVLKFFEFEGKRIRMICGVDAIKKLPYVLAFHLAYHEGERVKPVTNDTDRHGFYIAMAENEEQLNERSKLIESYLQIEYEGDE